MSGTDPAVGPTRRWWWAAALGVVLLAVVVGVMTVMNDRAIDDTPPSAASGGASVTATQDSPSAPPSPSADESTEATPDTSEEPPDTSDDGLLPPTVAGLDASESSTDDGAIAAGAEEAVVDTYEAGPVQLEVRASDWESVEAATSYAETIRSEEADQDSLIDSGVVGVPAQGTYWYYEENGTATIVWLEGSQVMQAEGDPYWVQNFFVQYPR